MSEMDVMQILAKLTDGADGSISDVLTFCQYKIPQSWCGRYDPRYGFIAHMLARRKVKYAQ